jgi:DNA-binding XRE family transcriptional regulator
MLGKDLAALVGCSLSTVYAIETRRVAPSLNLAARIAERLHVPQEQLFGPVGRCSCGCGGATYAEYLAASHCPDAGAGIAALNRRRLDNYRSFLATNGYASTEMLAAAAGVSSSGLTQAVRNHVVTAERYPGDWPSATRPLIWRLAEADTVRDTIRAHHARELSQAKLRWWADRRAKGRRLQDDVEKRELEHASASASA